MNSYYKFIFISVTVLAYSCNSNIDKPDNAVAVKNTTGVQKTDTTDIHTLLTSHMTDTAILSSFLDKITHQEKVKVLARLNTTWDDKDKIYTYSDSNYMFKLRYSSAMLGDKQKPNSIFIDGDNKISFKNYNITCFHDTIFRCEDYGFNLDNTLDSPKIIEVCGKRFLYADVSYWCNGIGCGCFLTFIYDLETHKPTFIENYRIRYKGFFISDFNNDNSPDLLVISRTLEQKMKGFDFDEFELRLTPFSYSNGVFKPHFDGQYQRTYGYELYSFTNVYHHSYHDNLIYSITNDNWFRQ
jgi:hypothetical protein